jgi:hypothetical protein
MRQTTVTANISDGEEEPTYASPPVVLDQYIAPFSVTYITDSETGTVEVTATDPFPKVNGDFTAPTFDWITAPTGAPNSETSLGQPFRAIRLSGGADGDTLTVVQAGVK